MTTEDAVAELLEPVVASLGAELVDVDFNGGILRLTVDQEGGVTTDVLATVNRTVSPILDQHDPVAGRYTLEVSSPGVERKLTKFAHFQRAVGENVIVKREPGLDPRRVKGALVEIEGDELASATLVVDATEFDGIDLPGVERFSVAMNEVDTARTVFDWGPAPKPGGKNAGAAKNKSGGGKKKSGKKTGPKSSGQKKKPLD